MGERIFADDWRACQEQHLRAVLSAGDTRTEATLVQVLQDIGFSSERLAELGAGQAPAEEQAPADEMEQPEEMPRPVAALPQEEPESGLVVAALDEEPLEADDEVVDVADADAEETPDQLSLF